MNVILFQSDVPSVAVSESSSRFNASYQHADQKLGTSVRPLPRVIVPVGNSVRLDKSTAEQQSRAVEQSGRAKQQNTAAEQAISTACFVIH